MSRAAGEVLGEEKAGSWQGILPHAEFFAVRASTPVDAFAIEKSSLRRLCPGWDDKIQVLPALWPTVDFISV